MTRAKLTITHGLPGSGKSTWAEQKIQANTSDQRMVRVNRDDIREKLFGTDYHKQDPDKEKEEKISDVENALLDKHLSQNDHVISDNTNLNPRFLPRLIQKANEHNADIEQKYFNVDVETCKQRNRERGENGGRFVPEYAIDRMVKSGYGSDGQIKKFYLGNNTVFAYDRAGVKGEDSIAEYNNAQKDNKKDQPASILFDMDGTLADVRELSDKYMSGKKRNFHKFHTESEFSPPNEDAVNIAKEAHDNGINVLITTARSSDYSQPTINWLKDNNVPATALYMRKFGDYRKDYEVKKDMLHEIRENGYEPFHAVDDNPQAIAAWEENGLEVTKLPFHYSIPVESSEKAAEENEETIQALMTQSTAHTSIDDNGNRAYPKINVESPFTPGKCIRCGSTLKDKTKTIGDRCKQLKNR